MMTGVAHPKKGRRKSRNPGFFRVVLRNSLSLLSCMYVCIVLLLSDTIFVQAAAFVTSLLSWMDERG